jgi:UDP-GlcNAc:undecaprenyl-phosphate GlcNAc-1-phosphate transferase
VYLNRQDHLHHRLAHALGSHKRSVIFIYALSLCLGISAVALRNARVIDAVLLIFQASILLVLITFLERRGRLQNKL